MCFELLMLNWLMPSHSFQQLPCSAHLSLFVSIFVYIRHISEQSKKLYQYLCRQTQPSETTSEFYFLFYCSTFWLT